MASTLIKPGATALIIGSASGVGYAMATLFRQNGMHLILLDNNEKHLSTASATLTSLKPSTSTSKDTEPLKTSKYVLDVGDLKAWQEIRPKILSEHPKIDVLMLNAGTSLKPTTKQSYEDVGYFQSTLQTNLYGVVNGLATFLSTVQETAAATAATTTTDTTSGEVREKPTAIIITGSKQGITNPPGANNPAYNMSKSALKTLAEHLAYDLRTSQHPSYSPGTSVHLLIPGWTFTGLSGNAGPTATSVEEEQTIKVPKGAWLPRQVAEYARQKIAEGRFYIVCPDDDVDEALDQARMEWAVGDVVEGRPALSRWEDGWKDEAAKQIGDNADARRKK